MLGQLLLVALSSDYVAQLRAAATKASTDATRACPWHTTLGDVTRVTGPCLLILLRIAPAATQFGENVRVQIPKQIEKVQRTLALLEAHESKLPAHVHPDCDTARRDWAALAEAPIESRYSLVSSLLNQLCSSR